MDKSYVTLEQKMCPICGHTKDTGSILLDTRLRPQFDMKTTTGYGLCKDCQEKKDKGYLALVVCNPEKTTVRDDTVKMEDAYRTGEIVHIKREVAKQMFNKEITKRDFVFIDTDLKNKLQQMVKQE